MGGGTDRLYELSCGHEKWHKGIAVLPARATTFCLVCTTFQGVVGLKVEAGHAAKQ